MMTRPATRDGEGEADARRMKAKICLVGEAAVGKTKLVQRFVLDLYDNAYVQSLGTKVYKKEVTVVPPEGAGTLRVALSVWDIMGQKGFRELLKDAYFYGAHGILAVSDVTRKETLPDLAGWIEGVHGVAGPVPIVLLANKSDLKGLAEIGAEDVARAAKAYDSPFFFTSAKTGENVERAFQHLAARIAKDQRSKGGSTE